MNTFIKYPSLGIVKFAVLSFCAVLVSFNVVHAGNDIDTSNLTTTGTLTANVTNVTAGQGVTLSWSQGGVVAFGMVVVGTDGYVHTGVQATADPNTVAALSGSIIVFPQQTTTYTLKTGYSYQTDDYYTDLASVTITVTNAPASPKPADTSITNIGEWTGSWPSSGASVQGWQGAPVYDLQPGQYFAGLAFRKNCDFYSSDDACWSARIATASEGSRGYFNNTGSWTTNWPLTGSSVTGWQGAPVYDLQPGQYFAGLAFRKNCDFVSSDDPCMQAKIGTVAYGSPNYRDNVGTWTTVYAQSGASAGGWQGAPTYLLGPGQYISGIAFRKNCDFVSSDDPCMQIKISQLYGTSAPATAEVIPAPTGSLTANPISIKSNESSTLTWSANNVATCTGTNFDAGTVRNILGTFSLTLSAGNNPDINALANGKGWDGKSPLKVTIPSGVAIGSSNPEIAAIDTTSLPAGTSLYLVNQGSILGAGGKGADVLSSKIATGANGGTGGAGIKATMPITINNTGIIRGGGGGGGAGSGNTCGECYDDPGGTGGGGAGSNGGVAGTLGTAFLNQFGNRLTSATNGTLTAGGTGGVVCGNNGGSAECSTSGNGGAGGAPEQPGSSGFKSNAGPGGLGGAPGVKIIGTNFVTYGTVPDVTAENGLSGTVLVRPLNTTTYTLSCIGLDGSSITKAVTVNVSASEPPTATISGEPSSIILGGTSLLTWGSTNATSCTGSGFSTGGATSGTKLVGPSTDTNYAVTCTNANTSATASKAIMVTVRQPSASISSSTGRAKKGDTVTISWNAQNVTSCTISGTGIGTTGTKTQSAVGGSLSGSQDVVIQAQSTYIISCSPSGQSSQSAATVNLAPDFQEF